MLLSERTSFNKEYKTLIEKLEDGKKLMENLAASIKNVVHLRLELKRKTIYSIYIDFR